MTARELRALQARTKSADDRIVGVALAAAAGAVLAMFFAGVI